MIRRTKTAVSEATVPSAATRARWLVFVICVVLAALVWIVFGQTLHHDFVNYDDVDYVTKNAQVSRGLSWEGILWAFIHVHASNWHPLTWISHMIDCQLYGLDPWGHHLTNVLFHGANAVLVFLFFRQSTRTLWSSAFIAALFAIHPLRVESVAWVSERKDLLSAFFFILTLMAYVRYTRAPDRRRYVMIAVLFALGLMSKPMVVSLPVVLLLLDYWPLDRFPSSSFQSAEGRRRLWFLLREKLPLLGLSLLSAVITIFAQRGSMQPITRIPLPSRLANAALACIDYLRDMFWPTNLAAFYPWETSRLNPSAIIIAFVLLAAISVTVILLRRRRYLVTGWLWYLIMVLPVIGILYVGNQSHADRYTYLPQIGIYLLLVWSAVDFVARWRFLRAPFTAVGCAVVVTLVFCARTQAAYWKDSESLWRHALTATTDNITAEGGLGLALHWKGNDREAMEHFERSLSINREQPAVLSTLGAFYLDLGRVQEALSSLNEALKLEPKLEDAHYNLGNTYLQIGNATEALQHYRRALELDRDDTEALNNTAWILATWPDSMVRNGNEAVFLAERADSLTNRENQVIAATLAAAYAEAGRLPEAVRTGERALNLAIKEKNELRATAIKAQLETYKNGNAYRDNRYH